MKSNSTLDKLYKRSSENYEKGIELWKIPAAMTVIILLILTVFIISFVMNREEATSPTVEPMMEYNAPEANTPVDFENYSFEIEMDIHSRSAIMINRTTGNLVCYKNIDAELPPASVTKAMTVLVALENVPSPSASLTVTGNSFERLTAQSASMAGLVAGQRVTVLDLCYAAILPSGGDAAVELAEYISGSEEAFVELMNIKANELGMTGTVFRNVTGLHDDDHRSTVEDMAMMLEYALQNPDFYQVFTAEEYTIPADSTCPDGLYLYSTVFDKANRMSVNKLNDGTLLGGKSGYTPQAGLCLATLTEVDGDEYIVVTFGADGTLYTPQYAMIDTYRIVNNYAN